MTERDFSMHYIRLTEEFGQQAFGKGRGKLIFDFIRDLSVNWWEGIVDRMILENNPRFNIADAARTQKSAFNAYKRTEEYVGGIQYMRIDCDKCNDIGYVRIRHHTPDEFDSLMLCGCIPGPPDTQIPEWDPQLSPVYKKTPVPIEWFKPKISEDASDQEIQEKLWAKVQGWSAWKKKAEGHWAQMRKSS